ncbi:hypothetical protein [Arsenicicoccus dermatophilus]|uniref:hypothetical protein n=1 Tax=Arsenicicoccus dermatophilus TaxID=1076331 RepID=UPI003916E410
MADYNAIIDQVAADINGFMGASIVDLSSGMTLAARSDRPNFDLEVASAYNSEMVKGKYKTMRALGIESELEDMLLTLGDQLHLIKTINDETFLYLAAEKDKTNLALIRTTVKQVFAKNGI